MKRYIDLAQHRSLLYRLLSIALLATTVVTWLAVAPAQNTQAHASPILLRLATEQPTERVGVIVQTFPKSVAVAEELTRLGGTIIRELPIINGFSATLEAHSIPILARHQGVRWISPDAPVVNTACSGDCYDPAALTSAYIKTIGADQVWNRSTPIRGRGISVAVIDSGVNPQQDLYLRNTGTSRLIAAIAFNDGYNKTPFDAYGHGTHVAGIIGGNGGKSQGLYVGVAPEVNIINIKVSDDLNQGVASTSSVVSGLQWVYDNHVAYNIRVVNISLTDSVADSYHQNALNAAVELLWFNGIVVVTAAGNRSDGVIASPANDPFVITVGATDDRGTPSITDDQMAPWSAFGTTTDGFAKPDLVAPGVNIVSLSAYASLNAAYPQNVVNLPGGGVMFRMSGTSMAAPMVAGAAALLLQDEPNLTPDQVKYRLKAMATHFGTVNQAGAGYLNIPAAIDGTSSQSANVGIQISSLLQDGSNPITWNSTSWSTAKWSTAKWSTSR